MTNFDGASAIRGLEEGAKHGCRYLRSALDRASRDEVIKIDEHVDVMTTCASKWARENVEPRALKQPDVHVPVLGLAELSRKLVAC